MRCIKREETDPYFNLAAEEYIFKNFPDDTFMLWRNEPSIIIGKHQNAFAEINHEFVRKHNFKVVRRISGGGSVYHDLGNLNFTFITKGDINNLVDFSKFTLPIIDTLSKLGLAVQIGQRNSLYIDGKKISGNAEHIYKDKIIHHGTLLFKSNLDYLKKSLTPSDINYQDKAVKSVRSTVTNISDHLPGYLKITEFENFIFKQMLNSNEAWQYELTEEDKKSITILKNEKYQTWEWNYGYSPAFTFSTGLQFNGEVIHLDIQIANGIINRIHTKDTTIDNPDVLFVIENLKGEKLHYPSIENKLNNILNKREVSAVLNALFVKDNAEHLHNHDV